MPYKHLGRDLNGIDCFGILRCIYNEYFGVEIPDYLNYDEDWADKGLNFYIDEYPKLFKRTEDLKEGDVIGFQNNTSVANHAGVYIGAGKFIHALKGKGVVISRINQHPWDKRKIGYFRLKQND